MVDSARPARSGIVLSLFDRKGRAQEGFLGLRDVYGLRLSADLVVLSACETALGRDLRGEGLVGLTTGFLYAGVRQVVASLWRVDDLATSELMARFYRGLLQEKLPAPAALRAAQLEMAADRGGAIRTSGPASWSWATGDDGGDAWTRRPQTWYTTRTPTAAPRAGAPMSPRSDPDARTLTPRAFALLLQRLGDDPERGGAGYESLRRALVRFFDWRGAHAPDVCADETLDRLARRLDEDASIEDVRGFAHGIARLVLLEQWRRPRELPAGVGDERLPAAAPARRRTRARRASSAAWPSCRTTAARSSSSYYAAEGRQKIDGRKRLAAALGVSDTALRNRAQRLRDRLERCIRRRLDGEADTKS